jgi:hypothetical protein
MSLTKIKNRFSFRHFLSLIGLSILAVVQLSSVLSAQSVTRGYGSDNILQRGMIVGLKKDDADKVESLDISRIKNILGVVVNQNDSPITISDDNERIFVTTSGRYEVLVSDQQGAIATNDYVTVSSLSGIGMKASENESDIVGRAIDGYDGKSGVLSSATLKDSKGQERTVNIGRIAVELAIGRNPIAKNASSAPAFLARAGEAIAGKAVSALRLYLSALIFGLGLITAGAVMYAGIRSSIIAIGRNPLGKRNIMRSLFGVISASVFIFIVSVIAVYLLLKI